MADYKKKLIEVALPLEAINKASAREKSIRHGHPSTLHLWWARRPLAACRAVLFAQMVDDPSAHPDRFPTAQAQEQERQRLFRIIEDLVLWENSNNEAVLERARAEIRNACDGECPPVYDPFSGGGSIPLEAQRLGLKAYGSDLNPVAVMIGKALVEIPPKFAGRAPVGPVLKGGSPDNSLGDWSGAKGLAEDVRRYGAWMREEAFRRIGHLYPEVELPAEYGGGKATVIAWLWARTVASPNPAFKNVQVPLVSNFFVSTKKGKETYIEPVIEGDGYRFTVVRGIPEDPKQVRQGTKLGRGAQFRCLMSDMPIAPDYIKGEGKAGRMGARLMAVVAEGHRGRIYLEPTPEMEEVARQARPEWAPDQNLPDDPRNFWTVQYGLVQFSDLFTPRQLVALTTFSDLVGEARAKAIEDAKQAGWEDDGTGLADGGTGATAYGDALAVYLAFAVDKAADRNTTLCSWESRMSRMRNTFGRQAIPMVWDYTETNPIGGFGGDISGTAKSIAEVLDKCFAEYSESIFLSDAVGSSLFKNDNYIISTDPPYYDNIGYADLSDFFYVWMRRSLRPIYPKLFSTMLVPKAQELIASPYRHGGKVEAESFFLDGMKKAVLRMAEGSHGKYPVTIYYAFKQAEAKKEGISSTGWATFLDAVSSSGFSIVGTWPMRTELSNRMVGSGTNALASSIVLVCRKRPASAPVTTRADFLKALKRELPEALKLLQHGNIAPVDMAQAAIGPGMAVFTRYARVLESDDSPMTVKTALQLINQALDEYLSEQEGEYDADTRFAITWFETHGLDPGPYGEAETLATARGVSVAGVRDAGIVEARAGKVRLLGREELPADWAPGAETRLTAWDATQHLIRTLESQGEAAAAALLVQLGPLAQTARDLAYRLYGVCERNKWAAQAQAYNGLVIAWPELGRLAATAAAAQPAQAELGI